MDSSKSWYNNYYSQKSKQLRKPWYEGALLLAQRNFPDFTRKRIFEIGTGTGEFISAFQADHTFGVDLSYEAVRKAHSYAPHAKVANAAGESLPFKAESFDIVVMCEVIEHVKDPDKVLEEIRNILADRGYLMISFPNYLHLLYLFIFQMSILFNKPKWIDRQIVDRILYYPSMKKTLQKHGFSLVDVCGTSYGHQKIPLLKKLDGFSETFDKMKLQFLSFHPVLLCQKL
ncbi:MAG: class I SAM-dependent methyltransferase [Chitinispirillaceae bacterium]